MKIQTRLAPPLAFGLLLLLFPSALRAQLANQPPTPQWLVGTAPSPVSKTFDHSGPLLKAILLVAAEPGAQVSLNGKPLPQVPPLANQPATSLDLTSLVRQGANELTLTPAGQGRIAALLELNGDLARKQWLATDGTWKSGSGASATPAVTVGAAVESAHPTPNTATDPAFTANPFDLKKTFDAYNSWQLAKPGAQNLATDPATLTLPPGFEAELIRSAQPGEDSWVALAFDSRGRITLAKEKTGLLRFTPGSGQIEEIDSTLKECRGLLYAHGALFAHANNTKGLFMLRDADADGKFDSARELIHTEGGVGHGRNHIKSGPHGAPAEIFLVNGNNVLLPSPMAPTSPLRDYGVDQLLPNPWDGVMFDGTVELPAGYILKLGGDWLQADGQANPDAARLELFAGGLRNPLDIALNREGEMFTFDADMERDVGASWYMPTRVLHVLPGADFGWRRGTGRFPAYYEDTLPSVVDIGLSSPTAITFGYGAKFPPRYEEALFICDWTYGRIIAVHLTPRGASYTGAWETFISGRPLNVTDLCVGPDGALWFITGGRGTQSGLYRVTYNGPDTKPAAMTARDPGLTEESELRRRLEQSPADHEIEAASASGDRFLRYAARLALERRPDLLTLDRLREERHGWRALTRWLAAARSGRAALRDAALRLALAMPWDAAPVEEQLAALRVIAVGLARGGALTDAERLACLRQFHARYPSGATLLNREICRLLVYLKSPEVLEKSLPLLGTATTSEDLVFYPLHLRYLAEGWTTGARRVMFDALNRAEKLNGASAYFKAIQDIRGEMAAALTPAQATELAAIIHPPKPVQLSAHALPGHTFKNWRLEDLAGRLDQVSRGRSFDRGKAAAVSAQCVFCHRMSNDPQMPAGLFGPELVQVSARFNRHDLLDHILNPSKFVDEKFRFLTIVKADGTQIIGSLESEDDERLTLRPSPLAPELVEIGKSMIRERKVFDTSPMPAGLLSPLKAEQILDLLAFIEAGGDPAHPNFRP